MASATISGATGHNPVPLSYNARDAALAQSRLLAAATDTAVSSAQYYQSTPASSTAATSAAAGSSIQPVTIQNTGSGATVLGGSGSATPERAAITLSALGGPVSVGGGSLAVTGPDTIQLGAGDETIQVTGAGSAVIRGAAAVTVAAGQSGGLDHFTMSFVGGASPSTVLSGAGSYSIQGGAGGGLFEGGKAGGNVIAGGTGNLTIFGGGTADSLTGGSGLSLIVAGAGNETLVAGHGQSTLTGGGTSGSDVFKITPAGHVAGVTDVVTNFTHAFDFLNVAGYGADEADYAMAHFKVTGLSGAITLQDGITP